MMHIPRTVLTASIAGLFALAGAVQAQLPPHIDQWLQEHRVGPHQDETVDYDALCAAAQEEGRVVVYASSSRGPASLGEGFHDMCPGIEVEWNTLGTTQTIERLIREQQAGVQNVDVVFMSDYPQQAAVLHPAGMVFSWVPPELRDVIPENLQQPLLAHNYAARSLIYNTNAHPDGPPIESIWELTEPEWNRRIILVDPRTEASVLDQLATIVANADEMAADYERVYGEPIELTTENAGYEWIKRIIENNPIVLARSSDAYPIVGQIDQDNPPIAIGAAMTHVRNAEDPAHGGLKFAPITTATPRNGAMLAPTMLNIAFGAPHPNAAKLLIHWLMGDTEGGAGMTPWFLPGNYPTRTDVTNAPEHPFNPDLSYSLDQLDFWTMDGAAVWDIKDDVFNFVNDLL